MIELEELDVKTLQVTRASLNDYLRGATGASSKFVWKIYRVKSIRFAVQSPWEHRPRLYNISRLGLKGIGKQLCRHHEGSNAEIEMHWYCNHPAVSPNGFCSEHQKSSPLAYYEKCVAGNWSTCYTVDRLWTGEKYAVYLLAFGNNTFKAGMTRAWRIHTRVVEQPHTIAYIVNIYDSIVSARQTERKLGRIVGVSEGMGVKKKTRLASSLEKIINRAALEEEAKRLASLVVRVAGETSTELFSILPRYPELFAGAKSVNFSDLVDKSLEIIDYWGGYLLTKSNNNYYLVEKKDILHRVVRVFELVH